MLEAQLEILIAESDGSLKSLRTIALLQSLLTELHPDKTRLFANYPNPFNPETWIPYQLADSSDVQIFIYDVRGAIIRHLKLGHQPAGLLHREKTCGALGWQKCYRRERCEWYLFLSIADR